MILVEADSSEEWDSRTDWASLAERAVRAAVAASSHAALIGSAITVEISVKFAGNSEVRTLNEAWRGKDGATNVLSFPMVEAGQLAKLARAAGGEAMLGDVVLAHGVCEAEADEKAVGIDTHAAHLIVHGTLHLLGYDHERSEDEADAMEKVEREALAGIGIADPYAVSEVEG